MIHKENATILILLKIVMVLPSYYLIFLRLQGIDFPWPW